MSLARRLALPCALLALTACGEKASDAPAAPAAPKASDLLPAFQGDGLAAVNAARPAGATLEFEAKIIDKDRVVAAVPKGWTESTAVPGLFKPGDDAGLGFMTKISIGTSCGGACVPKDWKGAAEKSSFTQFRDAERFEIKDERDLTGPAGKVIVAHAREGTKAYVMVARWKDGAERYYSCSATLDGAAAVALAPAFTRACEASLTVGLQ
ncbi:MAG: hypothetical protein H6706_04210 [Myxococcales bacterium]|nr:hypothetical protein [Myxococcales bacterium]